MDKPTTSCILQLRYKIVLYLADRTGKLTRTGAGPRTGGWEPLA